MSNIEQNDLISIIIPVFNVEQYIERCIKSVIKQSYKNIEIIIINDGTQDSSGEICDKYAMKDCRIRLIHKENEGVSKSRNIGIGMATGKYITFIDSDDYVEKDYIKVLYELCNKNDADISICGVKDIEDIEDIEDTEKIKKQSKSVKKTCNSKEAVKELLLEKYFTCVIWGKIYKKTLFKQEKFNEDIKIAEDFDLLIRVMQKCKKISINTFEKMYCYQIRKDSVTAQNYNKDFENEIKITERILKKFEKEENEFLNYAIKRYIRINVSCINKILKNNIEDNKIQKICILASKFKKKNNELFDNKLFTNI